MPVHGFRAGGMRGHHDGRVVCDGWTGTDQVATRGRRPPLIAVGEIGRLLVCWRAGTRAGAVPWRGTDLYSGRECGLAWVRFYCVEHVRATNGGLVAVFVRGLERTRGPARSFRSEVLRVPMADSPGFGLRIASGRSCGDGRCSAVWCRGSNRRSKPAGSAFLAGHDVVSRCRPLMWPGGVGLGTCLCQVWCFGLNSRVGVRGYRRRQGV